MKARTLLLALVACVWFTVSAFTGGTTVSRTVTIEGTGGTATVSFVYPSSGVYGAPEAIINSDHYSVPLQNTSHSYDPGIGYEDKWAGDAVDPATGIEYIVSFMIVGNSGSWNFQSDPVVDTIVP